MAHNKIDYVFKARVLNMGLDKIERQLSLNCFLNGSMVAYGLKTNEMAKQGLADEWQEAYKINHASYERRKRLEKRIHNFLLDDNGVLNDCVFLTLTFKNEILESTTPQERRRAVREYLKTQAVKYVANIDFGKDYEREHYHAVVQTSKVDMTPWLNKYGYALAERVKIRKNVSVKLAKYVAKLTNHAIKETTHRQALIYSR